MEKYDKLVEALRCGANRADKNHNCEKCRYYSNGCLCTIAMDDAAAAIEELKAIAHSHCVAASAYWEELEELKAQLPKRGEWINSKERMRPDMCSVCGCIYEADRFMDKIAWNYCPNCGAKMMEVQE